LSLTLTVAPGAAELVERLSVGGASGNNCSFVNWTRALPAATVLNVVKSIMASAHPMRPSRNC